MRNKIYFEITVYERKMGHQVSKGYFLTYLAGWKRSKTAVKVKKITVSLQKTPNNNLAYENTHKILKVLGCK